jgi:itaconate CoA-transferase
MTTQRQLLRERLKTADAAVACIPSGARIAMGLGVSEPPLLLDTLARHVRRGQIGDLSVYYLLSTGVAGNSIFQTDLLDRIKPVSLFHSAIERGLDEYRLAGGLNCVDLIPAAFSQVPRILCETVEVDTLITTVAPMDADGNFSLGTNADYALAVSRSARNVILEINPNMPHVGGNCFIPVSRVTACVEHEAPLLEIAPAIARPEDEAIGQIVANLIDDGACLQMGIGALPDAVCGALYQHRHLGIHTELLTPGLAKLMQRGVVDNSAKQIHPGRGIFAFAMGDAQFYRFLSHNDALEAHPVDYVNDVGVIAANDKMVSVNATLQVDLAGACNSEAIGARQYTGSGGQLDFVRGAYASRGGRSIIACHSTAAAGTISRIVPTLTGAVTTPRNDTHIIVTEFGHADLKGRTLAQRAHALIGLAHPKFRENLRKEARELGMAV